MSLFFGLAGVGAISACSPRSASDGPEPTRGEISTIATFSPEEVEAAQKLSLGLDGGAEGDSPFLEALGCRNALAATAAALRKAGALEATQVKQIEQAKSFFAQRAESLAYAEGQSKDQLRKHLDKPLADIDIGLQARVALGCLRRGTSAPSHR